MILSFIKGLYALSTTYTCVSTCPSINYYITIGNVGRCVLICDSGYYANAATKICG